VVQRVDVRPERGRDVEDGADLTVELVVHARSAMGEPGRRLNAVPDAGVPGRGSQKV